MLVTDAATPARPPPEVGAAIDAPLVSPAPEAAGRRSVDAVTLDGGPVARPLSGARTPAARLLAASRAATRAWITSLHMVQRFRGSHSPSAVIFRSFPLGGPKGSWHARHRPKGAATVPENAAVVGEATRWTRAP